MTRWSLLVLVFLGCTSDEPLAIDLDDPCPIIEVAAGGLEWVAVPAGERRVASISLRNNCEGRRRLVVDAQIEGDVGFTLFDGSVTLDPGREGTIEVIFRPTGAGKFSGVLHLLPHGLDPIDVPFSGSALPGEGDTDADTDADTDTDTDTDTDPELCTFETELGLSYTDEAPTDPNGMQMIYHIDGCARPDEGTWEQVFSLYTLRSDGLTDCAVQVRAVKQEPVFTCASCEYAFELEYSEGQHLGGGGCDAWGITPDFLEGSFPFGVDVKSYGEPVLMYADSSDAAWTPLISDRGIEASLVLTPFDDGERTQWWYASAY